MLPPPGMVGALSFNGAKIITPVRNRERIQERYLRDALPVRLAGLAADLGRVASSARHATGARRPQPCWRRAST